MNTELAREVFALVEAKVRSQPSPMEFEMAYQARIAMDRIRFAIKHAEAFAPNTEQMREASLQLLDALQRLETADRQFQDRSRIGSGPRTQTPEHAIAGSQRTPASSKSTNGIHGASSAVPRDKTRT